jgi:hypothetical protein
MAYILHFRVSLILILLLVPFSPLALLGAGSGKWTQKPLGAH